MAFDFFVCFREIPVEHLANFFIPLSFFFNSSSSSWPWTLPFSTIVLWPVIPWQGFPSGSAVKNLPAMQETQKMAVWSLGWEDPLEEGMATHFSILAWRIQWKEDPGNLRSYSSEVCKELDMTEVTESLTPTHTHTLTCMPWYRQLRWDSAGQSCLYVLVGICQHSLYILVCNQLKWWTSYLLSFEVSVSKNSSLTSSWQAWLYNSIIRDGERQTFPNERRLSCHPFFISHDAKSHSAGRVLLHCLVSAISIFMVTS